MLSYTQVDRSSFIPIYHQIAQSLKQYLETNKLQEDDLIPSERELCEIFGASRMTIRQAVDLLVQEGLLLRVKGKGTFVKKAKLRQPLTALTSFTMDMISQGLTPTSRVLNCSVVAAPENIAAYLNIPENSQVICLQRVRCANDKPHAYECSYLLYQESDRILEEDFTNRSLYELLREKCGWKLTRAKESIEVMECPDDICELLWISKGTPVFHRSRVTFDSDDCPVEYVRSCYRIDKYRFEFELDLDL